MGQSDTTIALTLVTLAATTFALGQPALAVPGDERSLRAADPVAARSLAAMARAELDARHPEAAAPLFDRAFDVDPHPQWKIAAANAWLAAGEPARALARLDAALDDGRLLAADREHATELVGVARELVPIVGAARRATEQGAHAAAMRRWIHAARVLPLGRSFIEAARAAERAHLLVDAERLLGQAAARADLSQEDLRWVADARQRVRERSRPTARAPSAAPWVLVGTGAALALGGVVALVVGEDYRDGIRQAKASAVDGVVTSQTRAEAIALRDRGALWSDIGWAALVTGAVTSAIGSGWLVGRDKIGARITF